MQTQERDTESQPVYSLEELTLASIDLLRAVEASAALQDQLTNRVLRIERYLAETPAPSEATDQPTLLQAAQRYAVAFMTGEGDVDDAVDQLIAAARREEIEQVKAVAPTMPQLDFLEAQRVFHGALAEIQAQAGPRDLRAIEALANMAAAAMRQADRAYYDVTTDVADTGPKVTERFMHNQTAKGWRLNESSLTIDWDGRKPNPALRARLLRDSFAGGQKEAEIRNEPTADIDLTAVAS